MKPAIQGRTPVPVKLVNAKAGGGNKPKLATMEDKLLFILIYKKTYPLQTAQGLLFGIGQSQANEWIHRPSPILESALICSGHMPERDGQAFERSGSSEDAPTDLIIDGTERRKQRPKDLEKQKEAYSGKKKGPYRQERNHHQRMYSAD